MQVARNKVDPAMATAAAAGTAVAAGGEDFVALDPSKVTFSSGSASGGNAAFLAEGTSSYWQSDGSRQHWVEVEIGAEGWSEFQVFLHEFGSSYEPETVKVEARVGGSLVTVGPDTFKIPTNRFIVF